jgi:two-component system alkaline phosphatase synthesis response regulator PhoP
MVHDDKHAIYLAPTFDVKAQAVDTKAKPLRLPKLNQGWLWTKQAFRFEVSTRKITVDPQPTNTNAKRLMIVDDDVEMRTLLAEYFRRLGFEVAEKESGAAALQTVTTDRFDCFILDVSMPEMSGLELLRKLRDRGIETPALFLTAHDMLDDKVAGFEAGADDYLAKPFSPRELEYRVEALLRRGQIAKTDGGDEDRMEIGELVVDKRRHEVSRGGEKIDLTPLEFQILELLASEPGRAWSRNDLLDRVWSTEYEGYQRNIDPHINRLRKKLEADPKNPHYVLTVRGVGYKLNENP